MDLLKRLVSCLVLVSMLIGLRAEIVHADIDPLSRIGGDLFEVESTAYCNPNGNLTATGTRTIEGLTCATCKEWLGCTISIYDAETMEWLGYWQSQDTGGDYRIKNGTCVDIYMNDKGDAIEWGRRKILIQVIRSVG